MDLKQQVCSLELAKRLKELGVEQKSVYCWCTNDVDTGAVLKYGDYWDGYAGHKVLCSAFTVAELGELLPDRCIVWQANGSPLLDLLDKPVWFICQVDGKCWVVCENMEADARAKILVWYLEQDSDVESEDINNSEYIERLIWACCSCFSVGREARRLLQTLRGVSSKCDTEGSKIDDTQADPVNHPDHYTAGGIEVIDIIETKGLGYHLGNALKYLLRMGIKDPDKWEEDLEKCKWYIDRYIEFRGGQKDGLQDG